MFNVFSLKRNSRNAFCFIFTKEENYSLCHQRDYNWMAITFKFEIEWWRFVFLNNLSESFKGFVLSLMTFQIFQSNESRQNNQLKTILWQSKIQKLPKPLVWVTFSRRIIWERRYRQNYAEIELRWNSILTFFIRKYPILSSAHQKPELLFLYYNVFI